MAHIIKSHETAVKFSNSGDDVIVENVQASEIDSSVNNLTTNDIEIKDPCYNNSNNQICA